MSKVDLKPKTGLGPESFKATCHGDDCDRTWEAKGTLQSRHEAKRAQEHANRTGHPVAVEWTNRR